MAFFNDPNNKELKYILFGLAGVLALLALVLTISIAAGIPSKITNEFPGIKNIYTITISGTGESFAVPDLALVNFAVVTEAKTVSDALAENTKKMNDIIDSMKSQGVEEKDLKTTNFSIYPLYEYTSKSDSLIYPDGGKRVLTGYEIQQSLEVKIRDMSKIGTLIEGATKAGANQVGNLQFTIDNEDNLKKEARQKAIEKAKSQAQEMASQLGVRLGKITNFSETGGGMPIYFMAERSLGIGGGGEAPQIETGENKIEITVSITYEIR